MKVLFKDLGKCKQKGVYKIENLITKEVYVGSTPKTNFKKRFRQHLNSLIANRHDNSRLQKSFNTYERKDFLFSVIEVIESGNEGEILNKEEFYLRYYKENSTLFNVKVSSSYPCSSSNVGISTSRKSTIKEGFKFYHAVKNNQLSIEEVPNKFKGFVIGKMSFKVWNKGLTKDKHDYSYLKVPKTKTQAYFEGRERFKETSRSKSKPIYIFDYEGRLLDVYRSATDIVEASHSDIFPLVLQSKKCKVYKGVEKKISVLEINNILKVLKGKQKHHKGLIFSFQNSVDYSLKPEDIKFCFKDWKQCYFHNKGAYKGDLYVESDEIRESLEEGNPEPSLT